MDKISGIIPSSKRVASVDLKESAPIRPGTPSFGRPEGVSALNKDHIKFDTAPKSAGIHQELTGWRSKEAKEAAIVSEMNDRFFNKKTSVAGPVVDNEEINLDLLSTRSVASRPTSFKADDFFSASRDAVQPEGLYPKGSFIDRTA